MLRLFRARISARRPGLRVQPVVSSGHCVCSFLDATASRLSDMDWRLAHETKWWNGSETTFHADKEIPRPAFGWIFLPESSTLVQDQDDEQVDMENEYYTAKGACAFLCKRNGEFCGWRKAENSSRTEGANDKSGGRSGSESGRARESKTLRERSWGTRCVSRVCARIVFTCRPHSPGPVAARAP